MRGRILGPALITAIAIAAVGCDATLDALGADEATRLTIDADVPILVRVPPEALDPAPVPVRRTVVVPVRMDLPARLREMGRTEDAETLEAEQDRIQGVVLREVEYEVADPNLLPAAVGPVTVYVAGADADELDGSARALGTTVPVPPRRAIATRELEYVDGGREAAADFLETLRFTVFADTPIEVDAGAQVPAGALVLRLTFKVRVRLDIVE